MRTSEIGRAACVVSLLLGLWLATAHAQTETSIPDCDQDPGCKALKAQASEHSKTGDGAEALRLYKLAYEARPDPRLLFNIARLHHRQGQTAEAIRYYQQFLASPVSDEDPRQRAQDALTELQPKTPPPLPPPPPPPPEKTPLYKRGWFWGVVVGGAVAVGLGIGLGVGLSQPRTPTFDRTFN